MNIRTYVHNVHMDIHMYTYIYTYIKKIKNLKRK